MGSVDISNLAGVLREHGHRVLNSESKLTLSESLLQELNNSFLLLGDQKDTLNTSFQVISSSNIRTDHFRDIQFLHDFLQKTCSLKIVADELQPIADILDISLFKNLKLFELYRVSANKVKGIQSLRAHIQFLGCQWNVTTLNEVLEKCGFDESQGFIWSELKEANFTHNRITDLDTSLEFVPWLHTLDLSHNFITDARPLNCLTNLKYLNLSYNRLESVPAFVGQICSRLQVLILNHNFIENISNLTALVNLSELDLGDNCLIDHKSLLPLTYLATLQCLSLKGNPLSYHPQHRGRTLGYLHLNTATVRFILDDKVLTKTEMKQCGRIQPIHHRTHLESLSSSVSNSTLVAADRPRRVRQATISDGNQDPEMNASVASVSSLLTSNDHLETKRTIEQLRKQYGVDWLNSQAGSLVQDALGLEKSLPISSSPYRELFLSLEASDAQQSTKESSEIKSETSVNGTEAYTTASEEATEGPYEYNRNLSQGATTDEDDDDFLGEGEESLYLVTPKEDLEPTFLVITDTHLWERDCSSGKEKTRWSVDTLLACTVSGTDPCFISLEFDTVKRDKQKREYQVDDLEAEKLAKLLNDLVAKSSSQRNRIIALKCMKCGTRFGEEKSRQTQKQAPRICPIPACSSTLVIEDDEQ